LANFEDLYAANGMRQAAETGQTDATVDGSRVAHRSAGARFAAMAAAGSAGLAATIANENSPLPQGDEAA
jgi:hypothetical protein